jgi:lipopolysaccharide exporter
MSIIVKFKQKLKSSNYLRNVVWQVSGNGIAQILGILAMPFLTRLYDPTHFAALNLFSQVIAILAILISWRFEHMLMLPKNDAHATAMFWSIARFYLVCLLGQQKTF